MNIRSNDNQFDIGCVYRKRFEKHQSVLIFLDLSPLALCMMGLQIFEAVEMNMLYIWLCCTTIPEMLGIKY